MTLGFMGWRAGAGTMRLRVAANNRPARRAVRAARAAGRRRAGTARLPPAAPELRFRGPGIPRRYAQPQRLPPGPTPGSCGPRARADEHRSGRAACRGPLPDQVVATAPAAGTAG